MATFTHTCAGCGKHFAIPERYFGRNLKCPACGAPFRVAPPAPPEPPHPPVSEEEPFPVAPPPVTVPRAASHEKPAVAPEAAALPEVGTGGTVYWHLRRIGVLSAALVSAVTNTVLGLGIALAVGLAGGFLTKHAPRLHLPFRGVALLIVVPLAYGAIGFVAGALGAALYNLASRFTGGLKIHLE